ncbi:hypothetical protein AC1031_005290 [Aphanomyces cochlioides]|nr:hypothetical protein AC1031_005290 [Aphanomyces cochlioides]
MPSKETIQDSFYGASTRRAYKTYQKQFEEYVRRTCNDMDPRGASTENCTDFFHFLYEQGKKARTIDQAKISEMLNLRWNDVTIVDDNKGKYLSVRLKWHKKANVLEECQIYHLIDETAFPCLRVCLFYEEYVSVIRASCVNINKDALVFPAFNIESHETPVVDWFKNLDQKHLRKLLQDMVQACPNLPIGVTLHSMRRGGCFYRVFESPQRRFNFRELMAWCRWADEKTCCEYLITRSISNEIDPRNLLRSAYPNICLQQVSNMSTITNLDELGRVLVKAILGSDLLNGCQPKKSKPQRQEVIDQFFVQKPIPTARSGREAWQQWFFADPKTGH